jgi:hypothetical protein
MARVNKTANSNDGMNLLTVMPFPAFNPLNWWALATPRNAALASLTHARLALDAWRAGADGMRAMVRAQQDEMLKMLDPQLDEAAESAATDETPATEAADADTATTLFVRPMIEATRAYGLVGRAFIVAQRDTLRAFAPESKAH